MSNAVTSPTMYLDECRQTIHWMMPMLHEVLRLQGNSVQGHYPSNCNLIVRAIYGSATAFTFSLHWNTFLTLPGYHTRYERGIGM